MKYNANLKIDTDTLGPMLLVDILEAYAYVDGKKTDSLIGHKYVVALTNHSLEKLNVTIPGKKLLEKPNGYVNVAFDDLDLSLYLMNGSIMVSAKATNISLVKNKD